MRHATLALHLLEAFRIGIPDRGIADHHLIKRDAFGPGAGQLAAELVTGAAPSVDPTPFRLSRFTDGSDVTAAGMM